MQPNQPQDWYWKGGLFSRPKRSPGMMGREHEKRYLAEFVASDKALLHIVGVGGVGKSYLARWLAWEARGGRMIGWIECSQRSVTAEGLVDSIAIAAGNDLIRDLLSQRQENLPVGASNLLRNCVDHCVEEIDRCNCILVLEDFHDLEENTSSPLQYRFLQQAVQTLQHGVIGHSI